MPLGFFTGRMGCGMGPCYVANQYFNNRKYLLEHKDWLKPECRECLEATLEDEKLVERKRNETSA